MIKLFLVTLMLSSNLEARSWKSVDELIAAGVRNKTFPGAALIVGNSKEIIHQSFAGDGDHGRIYDVASLTKVMATTMAIMMLEERGELKLTDKLFKYFPEFTEGQKGQLTLEDLLRHRAGLPSGSRPLSGEEFSAYIKRISSAPLTYVPRTQTVYSDLSMILLGRVVEIVTGTGMDDFCLKNIFQPLNMLTTDFKAFTPLRCALTSPKGKCEVHDPTAFAFRPHAVGSAGVFSTIVDLTRFARMILNKGELDGVRIIFPKTIDKMLTKVGPRGLGWDFTSEFSNKPRGDFFPAGVSFGHTGYTGTTLWIDPQSGTYYVFLSNRVLLGDERTKKPFGEFRHALSTAIGRMIYPAISIK
jgi:CubicO group peptidase (beta-lactamase class C family)